MNDSDKISANGECPACAMPLSFAQANLWGRGKPFLCKGCGQTLMTDKVRIALAVAAFALASFLGREFGILAVLAVLIVFAIYEWLTIRVRLADDGEAASR